MIRIYTVPDCECCMEAKKLLKSRKIDYEEYNLKEPKNRDARAFYRSLGATSAPIIVKKNGEDEMVIVDYTKEKLIKLLGGKQW